MYSLHLRGGCSLDFLEEMLSRKQQMGNVDLNRYTPEQYLAMGIEGAYYDRDGRIQFAPPGLRGRRSTISPANN